MREYKNSISCNVRNITLNLQNITAYFTGKAKIITLFPAIIILSFVNITFTSALSYQSSVEVGFTFNPTLSVSISPSDLVISNLVPGSTLDSNVINVSIASNASYGYALSTIINGNNNDLTHSNGINTFSSIATNADLSDLEDSEDTNIWGYSYKDNTVVSPTWSNYNGLSSSNSTILLDTNSNNSNVEANGIDSIDFKIGAKAASAQASGTYTGVINFTAVTKPTPMNLAESYFAAGKTRHNGYYAMQDMTSEICNNTEIIGEGSQTELIDLRDSKIYWATKLADGHCWMTQNLDLDLSHDRPLTSEDTDLSIDTSTYGDNTIYMEGYNLKMENETITLAQWVPIRSTIVYNNLRWSAESWQNDYSTPYSYDYLDKNGDSVYPDSLATQANVGNHGLSGNYYNWSAAVASNNSASADNDRFIAPNSVCSKNWRLATVNDYTEINSKYNGGSRVEYENLTKSPLYFIRAGKLDDAYLKQVGSTAIYWESNVKSSAMGSAFYFNNSEVSFNFSFHRNNGFPVRCLAR